MDLPWAEECLAAGADPNASVSGSKDSSLPALWQAALSGPFLPDPARRSIFRALQLSGADPSLPVHAPSVGLAYPHTVLGESFRSGRLGPAADLLSVFPVLACASPDDLFRILSSSLESIRHARDDERALLAALDLLLPAIESFGSISLPKIRKRSFIPLGIRPPRGSPEDPFQDFRNPADPLAAIDLLCSPLAFAWLSGLDLTAARLLPLCASDPPIAPAHPALPPPFSDALDLLEWIEFRSPPSLTQASRSAADRFLLASSISSPPRRPASGL